MTLDQEATSSFLPKEISTSVYWYTRNKLKQILECFFRCLASIEFTVSGETTHFIYTAIMAYLLGHTCSFEKFLLLQVFFVLQLQANTPFGYLREQSDNIVEFCNKNGHRNLILTTMNYNSGDVKDVLLHLLKNSSSTFAVPKSSNDVIAHQCQNKQCHRVYKDIMYNSSFIPTLH